MSLHPFAEGDLCAALLRHAVVDTSLNNYNLFSNEC